MKRSSRVLNSIHVKKSKDFFMISSHENAKRIKLELPWVTPSELFNAFRKDHIVDWLKLKFSAESQKFSDFTTFIMQRGNDFEKNIVAKLKENHPVISVGTEITPETCQKTIDCMKKGDPIIHSAPFSNENTKIRGILDLLVRSDYLGNIIATNPLTRKLKYKKASKLNGNYHYVVIDIKFTTLHLRADGVHLLNSGNCPAYKAQTYLYNREIGKIQGFTPLCSFLLGRRWKYTSKGEEFFSDLCFDRLGVINFATVDKEYPEMTETAINWLRDVKIFGKEWTSVPPSREELYPNMCIDSGMWNPYKKKIAEELAEITSVWFCGTKNRNYALSQGVTSWRDKKCTSETLNIRGSRSHIIDAILQINQQDSDLIRPSCIKTGLYGWREVEQEVFVDFETLPDIFSDLEHTGQIFMIGVYGVSEYKNFTAEKTGPEEEYRIMDEFIRFLHDKNITKIWYWHAEVNMWRKCESRLTDYFLTDAVKSLQSERKIWRKILNSKDDASIENDTSEISPEITPAENIINNWDLGNFEACDMANLFRTEPIVLKGCFKFGLKEITNIMHKHGFINVQWTSNCDSGLTASANAWDVYQKVKDDSVSIVSNPVMKDIIKYNESDVKALYEILTFLRENL